jgi:8-oxo-dGTP pyrophosphatase MutT (NUDIX family)
MGGALVFPGGKVEPGDESDDWADLSTPLGARGRSLSDDPRTARAFSVAALRETLEEAAIVPTVGDRVTAATAEALRSELAAPGAPSFATCLRRRALVLDTGRLEALSRWITPVGESRRFDTRFYVLVLPQHQEGCHDAHETTKSFWATPREILDRWEAGEVHLAPPTSWTIGLFCTARDVRSAFAIARRASLSPVCPCFVEDAGQMVLVLLGDPLHPDGAPREAGLGVTRFVLRDARFVPVEP